MQSRAAGRATAGTTIAEVWAVEGFGVMRAPDSVGFTITLVWLS